MRLTNLHRNLNEFAEFSIYFFFQILASQCRYSFCFDSHLDTIVLQYLPLNLTVYVCQKMTVAYAHKHGTYTYSIQFFWFSLLKLGAFKLLNQLKKMPTLIFFLGKSILHSHFLNE